MRTKSSGFTLLEILIVLVVIQLIWFISLYTYNNQTNKYKFESWYQQFELDLLYLQIHTMTTSNRYVLQFNPDKNYYAIDRVQLFQQLNTETFPAIGTFLCSHSVIQFHLQTRVKYVVLVQ